MSNMNRREFMQTVGAAAAAAAAAGCSSNPEAAAIVPETAPEAPQTAQYDARKDALKEARRVPLDENGVAKLNYEVEKLPEGKTVQLDMLASQVYQYATVGDTEGNLKGIVLPKSDGATMKVLLLNKDQEVQLRVFANKDAKEPVVVSGQGNVPNLQEGKSPNWMKPVIEAVEKDTVAKGAKNDHVKGYYDFPLVQSYLNAANAGKLGEALKGSALFLDSTVKEAIEPQKAK